VWTPKFWGRTSSSITLSQVDLGRPGGLRQSGGGRSAAAMTRWWSSSGADRAGTTWPFQRLASSPWCSWLCHL